MLSWPSTLCTCILHFLLQYQMQLRPGPPVCDMCDTTWQQLHTDVCLQMQGTLLHKQQCGTVHSRSTGMVLMCSRMVKVQTLTVKKKLLEKAQKQADPRLKAPELQKDIQSCSHDILEMVCMLLRVWPSAVQA